MKRRIVSILVLTFVLMGTISVSTADIKPGVRPDYADVHIKEIPIAVQCWTFHKFTFMETLQKVDALGVKYLQPYRGQKLSKETGDVVFGPDLTDEQIKLVKSKLMEYGISLVSYGVVNFENNETDARKVFDFARKMGIWTIVTEPQYDDYEIIEKLADEYRINVAVHNHPVPSKYARPETVLTNIAGRSDRLGACADTGHWMRTGINPVEALVALEGRIKDVHLKDLGEFGKKDAHDVLFGSGLANVHDILAELTLQDYQGYISIEHEHPDEWDNPSPSIKKGLDYIRSITYYKDYEQILKPGGNGYTKHGWNHYGPGYFELDPKTGILTGQGGMGLFWYSAKKYGDFVLELDYRCGMDITNSGVFVRVPDMPFNNSYINHSFEIQICDAEKGIHRTGSAYDAEAPKLNAWNPTGEWNHYKISFIGDTITVELNGKEVLDWKCEPRGKIRDWSKDGYIGLQNHDSNAIIQFKNIYVKEL